MAANTRCGNAGSRVMRAPVAWRMALRIAGDEVVPFLKGAADWVGDMISPADSFVTGIGAGTTYPDYKPAPFIVGRDAGRCRSSP